MFRLLTQSLKSRKFFTSILTAFCLLTAVMLVKGWQPGKQAAVHASTVPQATPATAFPSVDVKVPGAEFPDTALIGETFCYTALVTNTGGQVGFGPYLQLVLPPGVDLDSVSLPGLNSTGASSSSAATYPISPPPTFVGTFANTSAPPNTLLDPLSGQLVTGPNQGKLYIIKLPIGSMYANEPGIPVQICLKVDGTVAPDVPLNVCHNPMFQYTSATTPPAIPGTPNCQNVTPVVALLYKLSNAPSSNHKLPLAPNETATGSCHPLNFELVANVADSKTITNLVFGDTLPPEMVLLSSASAIQASITGLVNPQVTIIGQTITVTGVSATGSLKPNGIDFNDRDVVIPFQAYIQNTDINSCAGHNVLNTATLNAQYQYTDAQGVFHNVTLAQQSGSSLIEAKHVALQKSAQGPNAPADPTVMPGDFVNYELDYQISENVTGFLGFRIEDTLPSNMTFVPGTSTISYGSVVNLPISANQLQQPDGTTLLTFNPPAAALGSCTKAIIRYKGQVPQDYNVIGIPVLASDKITNLAKAYYSMQPGAKNCLDDTGAEVKVKPVSITKSLPEAALFPDGYKPGDLVKFRLKMEIPSGDTSFVTFTDFLPLPVFKVPSYNGLASGSPYNVSCVAGCGVVDIPNSQLQSSPTDNSIRFTLKPDLLSTSGTTPLVIELEFSIPVTTDPFADDLYLTNVFQSLSFNTFGDEESHLTGVVVHVRAPKLQLTKGVFSSDNTTSGVVISPPPTTTPVDGNISGVDASDTITFYITVKNVGGATAYLPTITDVVPTGMVYVGASLMAVSPAVGVTTNDTNPPTLTASMATLAPGQSFIVKFSAKLPPTVQPCQTITNTASAVWSSASGATLFSPVTDSATITTARPVITKTITGTNQAHTTGNNVAIGEIVSYQIVIAVPEGVSNNLQVMDTIPAGLALRAGTAPTTITAIPSSAALVLSGGGSFTSSSINTPGNGSVLNFNFGTVTNSNTNNSVVTISFTYDAVVLNVPTNVNGTTLSNSAKVTVNGCAAQTVATTVNVVEPKLQITKTPSVMTADAGDTITWTITVTNANPSTADAFQVKVSDLIPTIQGQSYVAGSLMTVSGLTPTSLNAPVGSQPWTAIWNSFPLGGTSTIKFQTLVGNSVAPCATLTNTASVNWASIPATTTPITALNPNSCPRMGTPALCGSPNNYTATATATVSVPGFTVQKSLTATSAQNTTGSNVTIGEILTYQLSICVPEGSIPSFIVTDVLPPGLEAVSATLLPGIAGTGGALTITPGCGATQTFNILGFSNPGDNNPANNCFAIELQARVCDVPSNSGMTGMQTVLNNSFSVGIPGDQPGFPPVCVSTSNQVPVTVVEPKLDVKKTFSPTVVQPGSMVQITVTVTNTGTSEAYGLALTDVLGSCLHFGNAVVSQPGYFVNNAAGTLTIVGPSATPLAIGATLTVTITATVGECCFVPNTVTATATTLPDVQTGERPETGSGSANLIVKGNNCPCFTVPSSFNMKAWWSFDETTGTVANDSAGGVNNVGTYGAGSAAPTPGVGGVVGKAILFDGMNDYIRAAHDPEIEIGGSCATGNAEDFTIDAWLMSDGPVGYQIIVDKRAAFPSLLGYSLFLLDGRIGIQINGQEYYSPTTLPVLTDNQWHFIAVTVKRCPTPEARFYVDGALIHTVALASSASNSMANGNPLFIGSRSLLVFGGLPYKGRLDELELFKRVLTDAELDQIYQAGAGGKCKTTPCQTPSFGQPTTFVSNKLPYAVAPGDFNHDGNTDLAVANGTASGNLAIFEGKFGGILKTPPTYFSGTGAGPRDVVAGDFNGDSFLDLAVAGTGSNKVVSFRNTGGLNFLSIASYNTGSQPWHLTTGYFNAGPALDLGVVNFLSNNARILLGAGTGTFTMQPPASTDTGTGSYGPVWVESGDINTNANTDLLVANSFSNHIGLMDGNGAGGLSLPGTMNSSNKPVSLATGDFDGDSKLDLVVVNNQTNDVRVFKGDGAGGFTVTQTIGVGLMPTAIAAGDVNCDGLPDLVVGHFDNGLNNIAVLVGQGNATFAAPVFFPSPKKVQDVALADMNNDGSLDIVTANFELNVVAVLLNNCHCGCKPPLITVAPVSQKVCANDSATFTAVAQGNPPMTMQWESSADGGLTWTPISGQTGTTFTTNDTTALFHAVFTSACGSATTDAVTVSIDPNCVPCPGCPISQRIGPLGSTGQLTIQAPANVSWQFTSNRNWIVPTSNFQGMGNGAVDFIVQPNPLGIERSGMISFAGVQYSITQDAATTTRTVRVVAPSGPVSPGVTFNVPIEVVALGNENSLYFSLGFNPNVLGNPQVALGSGATGATLDADENSLPGRLGIALQLPEGQTLVAGTRQVAVVSFTVAANPGTSSTPLDFDDLPTPRLIQDVNFGLLPSNFTGATIPLGCNLAINPPALPNGTTNTLYSQTFTASGGAGPYTFARVNGPLPPGLTLSGSGALSGTPTSAGTFNFTVQATDSLGCTGTKAYALTINAGCAIVVSPATAPNGFVGTFYSQTLTQSGGTGTITWSISAGSLPNGLILSAAGGLSGTPTSAGTFSFTVQATDINGCTGSQPYTVTISGSGLQFFPLPTPVRLTDTRPGQTACSTPGNPIAGGTAMTQAAAGFCGIPATARAIMGNVTVVTPAANGFVTIFPSSATQPTAANTNFIANDVLNNVFTVGLGAADGAFKIFASTTVHVVVDVTGYFAPPATGGLYFHTLPSPIRLEDTRVGQTACFTPGTPLPGGVDTTHQGTTTCNGVTIPSTARAMMGNVTVVLPAANGFITAFPADAPSRPLAATGNYRAGAVLNSPFTVGLSPSGQFKLYSVATTDVVIDVLGYFSPDLVDVNGTGLLFTPITPARLQDSRPGQPACFNLGTPLPSGVDVTQAAAGSCTIASTARAMMGNVTVVLPPANGFITFWPTNVPRPLIATSNFTAGRNFNRFFTVGLGPADGAFKMYSLATPNIVIDVSGYFAP